MYLIREREPQRYVGNVVGREEENSVVKCECDSERPENFRCCVAKSLISEVISRQPLENLVCRTNSVDCSMRRIQSVAKLRLQTIREDEGEAKGETVGSDERVKGKGERKRKQ